MITPEFIWYLCNRIWTQGFDSGLSFQWLLATEVDNPIEGFSNILWWTEVDLIGDKLYFSPECVRLFPVEESEYEGDITDAYAQ